MAAVRRLDAAVCVSAVVLALGGSAAPASAQVTRVWNGGMNAAWTSGANWTPSTAANAWGVNDTAQFSSGGAQTSVNVGMQFFTANTLSIGAIEMTSARTLAMTLGNSSGTPVAGTLALNGATIGSDANVILHNSSSHLLTLQPTNGAVTQPMAVALGNATANVVVINGSGGVTVSSVVSGVGKSLTLSGTGTGKLKLTGANTFDGGVIINSGTVYASNSSAADSATGSGAVTVNGGTLGGVGYVAGAVTVGVAGTLAPGESVGSLVMKSDVDLLGTLSIEYDDAGPGMDIAVVQGDLDISAGTLSFTDISNGGAGGLGLSAPVYVFATYGSRTGSQFASVVNLPANYEIDYAYFDGVSSNNIALIMNAVPEASSVLLVGLASCVGGGAYVVRRRRK